MSGEGLNCYGWPYGHPINTQFDVNWDSPQALGLVAWWPMIGSQGGWPVIDRAFHRYPMTPFNTPTWQSDGEKGWSINFVEANSEYLETAGVPVLTPPFTFSCWFRRDAGNNRDALISLNTNAGAHYSVLRAFFTRFLQFSVVDFSAGAIAQTTTQYVNGVWNHCCGVAYSTSSRAVFLNGGGKGTNAVLKTPNAPTQTTIGDLGNGSEHTQGNLQDVRIYNRAFADTEVQLHATNPWEMYRPRIPRQLVYVAPAAAAIMNQIQFGNLGADLFDGTLIQ